ncbi:hypothetical protein HOY80DRAFT_739001 [Tuber brumale]|nr:hypothetical protein HOY80DRAFT_739001 [Tuber brumale]
MKKREKWGSLLGFLPCGVGKAFYTFTTTTPYSPICHTGSPPARYRTLLSLNTSNGLASPNMLVLASCNSTDSDTVCKPQDSTGCTKHPRHAPKPCEPGRRYLSTSYNLPWKQTQNTDLAPRFYQLAPNPTQYSSTRNSPPEPKPLIKLNSSLSHTPLLCKRTRFLVKLREANGVKGSPGPSRSCSGLLFGAQLL